MGYLRDRWKNENATTGAWHSHAYHEHFSGWSERKVEKDGKTHIERVYTGIYHIPALLEPQWKKFKRKTCVYVLLAFGLWILGAVLPGPHALVWYTQVASALSIVMSLWLFYVLILTLSAPYRMTDGEYHAGPEKLPRICRACRDTLLLGALTHLFYLVLAFLGVSGQSLTWQGALVPLASAFCYGIGGFLLHLAMRAATAVSIENRESEEDTPEGAVEISTSGLN